MILLVSLVVVGDFVQALGLHNGKANSCSWHNSCFKIYIYIYIIGLHFDEGIASIGDVMNFYNEFLLSCFVFEIEV